MLSLKRKREEEGPEVAKRTSDHAIQTTAGDGPDDPANGTLASSLPSDSDILSRLKGLLDLSSLTKHTDFSARFADIAEVLLNHVILHLNAEGKPTNFQILELEFYLFKSGCHEDPFTHGSDERRQSGKWYFHRAPRRTNSESNSAVRTPTAAGGYRGGTRKGLDLTFAGPVSSNTDQVTSRFFSKPLSKDPSPSTQNTLRGGVLLRTLRNRETGKLFSGPSLLVDELLRLSGASNIAELVKTIWKEDADAFPSTSAKTSSSLRLRALDASDAQSKPKKVYRSPRIGLDLSNPGVPLPAGSGTKATLAHPRTIFISKRYRYFVQPALLTSNGRGHTLLGVYDDLVRGGNLSEGELVARLESATALKQATVGKYLGEYRAGKTSGLRSFVGAQGKGAGSSPVPFLRMLGCLDAL